MKGAIREYMGCEIIVSGSEISYLKNRFLIKFRVSLRENPLCDFIVLGKNQIKDENGEGLNYHSIIMGFVSGCMKSMAYHPTISLISDSLINDGVGDMGASMLLVGKTETVFDVEMWKDKEEDWSYTANNTYTKLLISQSKGKNSFLPFLLILQIAGCF